MSKGKNLEYKGNQRENTSQVKVRLSVFLYPFIFVLYFDFL